MAISSRVREFMTRASWIRRMFEEAIRLRAKYGEDAVTDLSLGNPELEPPTAFTRALRSAVDSDVPGLHRYMPNVGYTETREVVAAQLSRETGLDLATDDVIMSCGAAGGLNVVLKAILEPGEEVIVLTPFFPEYEFYIDNHCGVMRLTPTRPDFHLDLEAIEKNLGPRTKALILNSPNNPTGRMYDRDEIAALGELLKARAPHAYLLSDEAYKRIVFDGKKFESAFGLYPRSIAVNSHSKDLAIPGERIGYIALSPEMDKAERQELFAAMAFLTRTLGYINAPALMQRVVRGLQGVSVDPREYEMRRDLIYGALKRFGYEVEKPDGAFYIFPRSPDPDDLRFIQRLAARCVLTVPGSGFGVPGYFRIAYCVSLRRLERALPALEAIAKEYGLSPR